jgi:hypothetical protein
MVVAVEMAMVAAVEVAAADLAAVVEAAAGAGLTRRSFVSG